MSRIVSGRHWLHLLYVWLLLYGTSMTIDDACADEQRSRNVGTVERLDPLLDKLVPPGARMEVIGEGYAWCEGPVWVPKRHFLLFSDIPNNAIMRWDAKSG